MAIQRWWRAKKSSKISQNEDGVSKKKKKLSDCNFALNQTSDVGSRAGMSKNRRMFGFLFNKTPSKTSSVVSLDTVTTCRLVIEAFSSLKIMSKTLKPILKP